MHILAKDEHHSSLSELYNEIMNQPTNLVTFRTNNTQFHNSFLPLTNLDLKGRSNKLSSTVRDGLANVYRVFVTEAEIVQMLHSSFV